ncbi:MAG: amylo-alpha-1,6-glucosidase [Lysobacter sp.]
MDQSLVHLRARDDTVYVSHGGTVLATQRDGFLSAGAEQGLFVDQTRLISRYCCVIDGELPLPVALSNVGQDSWLGYYLVVVPGVPDEPASLSAPESLAQQSIEMRISRVVGEGLHEDFDFTNFTQQSVRFRLALDVDADFADQEETKAERQQHGSLTRQWNDRDDTHELVFDYQAQHHYDQQGERGIATLHRSITLRIAHADTKPSSCEGRIEFQIELPPQGRWHACLLWIPRIEDRVLTPPLGCRAFEAAPSEFKGPESVFLEEATEFASAESGTLAPVVLSALAQARRDLLALRLPHLDSGTRAWTVAAGLPMYVALFGRDTLTVAWEAALLGPELMRGTLPALASVQGTEYNDWRDEQPGRMLHEAHTGPLEQLNFTPKGRYYGAHTTSAFYPFVVAQLWHWTADRAAVAPFIEPALKAVRWLDSCVGPRGFHEYRTRSRQGVENQGWKDSHDAIVYEDGRAVPAPIATCEEQGLVYAAKLNFAEVLWWFDRKEEAKRLFHEARELKQRFNDAFWMEREGFFAMALDPSQRPVRSIASNALHCVATGIADEEHVLRTMERLFAPDLFSGWGIRTLSSEHPAFNPYAYHRGTVWPVEHGPFAVGAYRYGLHDRVEQICRAQFEAAALFEHHRLPELFSGHARDADHPFPALYPAANSPQAWSSSTVFTLLQAMLGLQPFAPFRMLFIDPHLPTWLPDITLRRLRVADTELSLRFYRKADGTSDYEVLEQRGKLHVIRQPSPWSLTANFGERLKDLLISSLPGK